METAHSQSTIKISNTKNTKDDGNGGNNKNKNSKDCMARSLVLLATAILVVVGFGCLILAEFTEQHNHANANAPTMDPTPSPTMAPTGFDPFIFLENSFGVDLPSFGDAPEEKTPYRNHTQKLRADAEQLARYLIANEIYYNLNPPSARSYDLVLRPDEIDGDGNPVLCYESHHMEEASGMGIAGPGANKLSPSFGTNNVEERMDRQDVIKASSKYLFVADGHDTVMVLAVEGDTREIARVKVPFNKTENNTNDRLLGASRWIYQEGSIAGLLYLPENKQLVVILSGTYRDPERGEDYVPALLPMGTRVVLFSISEEASNADILEVESIRDLHGSFVDAYSTAEGVIHVATKSVINKWRLLLEPVHPTNTIRGAIAGEVYATRATNKSLETLIPSFAEKLTQELVELGLETNLGRFWMPPQETTIAVPLEDDMESPNYWTGNGYEWQPLRGSFSCRITSVHSIGTSLASPSSSSAAFGAVSTTSVPTFGYSTSIYAHANALVLIDEMMVQPHDRPHDRRTTLVAMRLTDNNHKGSSSSSSLVGAGTARGSIIDSYSVDFHGDGGQGDVLRVATNYFDPERYDEINTIFVFGLPDNAEDGALEPIGKVEMGKPGETFRSTRFLDTIAYAVTFETTDPFYAVDLSVPEDPRILGELEITGFSEYLHPIGGNRMLGIGVEMDDERSWEIKGAQVSLLDVRNPTEPGLVDRLVFENQVSIGDGFDKWVVDEDPRAFRYVASANGTAGGGVAIVPVGSGWGVYDGFYVVSVTDSGLVVDGMIDHLHDDGDFYSTECHRAPTRSFFFGGDKLVTFMGTKVVSTNLATMEQTLVFGDEHYCVK